MLSLTENEIRVLDGNSYNGDVITPPQQEIKIASIDYEINFITTSRILLQSIANYLRPQKSVKFGRIFTRNFDLELYQQTLPGVN